MEVSDHNEIPDFEMRKAQKKERIGELVLLCAESENCMKWFDLWKPLVQRFIEKYGQDRCRVTAAFRKLCGNTETGNDRFTAIDFDATGEISVEQILFLITKKLNELTVEQILAEVDRQLNLPLETSRS